MSTSLHLVQLSGPSARRIALVEEPRLRLLDGQSSIYALAQQAIAQRISLSSLVRQSLSNDLISYDAVYNGDSEWQLRELGSSGHTALGDVGHGSILPCFAARVAAPQSQS